MPRPKAEFEDLRPLEFREPDEVLESDRMYTIYEVGRLLQGVEPDRELDVETENVLFAEPDRDDEPGYYGLAEGSGSGVGSDATNA